MPALAACILFSGVMGGLAMLFFGLSDQQAALFFSIPDAHSCLAHRTARAVLVESR
tara:strand:+ start:20052 stop:20219 length:168 start_codon:yes stop_codon:yes gene_type:complete